MVDAKRVLQDLIDGMNQSVLETEGIIQAQQGCLIAYKRMREQMIAKKRGIEEQEKQEQLQETQKKSSSKKKTKKSGLTPLKD